MSALGRMRVLSPCLAKSQRPWPANQSVDSGSWQSPFYGRTPGLIVPDQAW